MHVLIRDFHIIASPLRLATWINNMIKDAAKSDDSAGEPPAAAAEEKDEGDASAAASAKASTRGVEAALRSTIDDMKSQHLVLNFNLFGVADCPDGKRVFARVSNEEAGRREDDGAGREETGGQQARSGVPRPALFFENVYFVEKLRSNRINIMEAFAE